MKPNWPIKKLGEVVEFHYGKGISSEDRNPTGKYPIYGANGELGRTDKYLVGGEAIIVGRKGTAGEVNRVSGKFWPSDVTYYVFDNEKIDIDFLFYLFKKINLKQFAKGVKPGINRNDIYKIEIPVPPIGEQKRIVAKLEKILSKIEKARTLRKKSKIDLEMLWHSSLEKAFSDIDYNFRKIGEVVETTSGGTPSRSRSDYYGGKIPWVKSGELEDNFIDDTEEKITELGLKNSSAKIFSQGTLLIAMYGATVGRLGILKIPAATNQAICGIVPNKVFNNKFLYYYLITKRKDLLFKSGGGAQPNISQTIIKDLEIPVLDQKEQEKIVAYLDSLSEKVRRLQELQKQTQQELDQLSQSVLHQAFQGEL